MTMETVAATYQRPAFFLCSAEFLRAYEESRIASETARVWEAMGADRRRVKREVRKATERAR